jgi:HTH-type transcriptional regulator / antitoxin HigA
MGGAMNRYNPDYAIHPGEYLEEVLESREIKKRDFAERIGLSEKAVSQIINRKALYSPDVALMLEKTLDIDAEIWISLANAFQLSKAREKERILLETEKTKEWVKRFPTADLRRLGLISNSRKPEVLADEILRFFNVSNPDVWEEYNQKMAVSYRKSDKFKESAESTAVWLELAEKEAENIETENFDRALFKKSLAAARDMTVLAPAEFYPKIVEYCRSAGVALVLVPELKDTHISGAASWLSQHKAMIAVSLRYKTNDHFWFTFFHEAAHILLHKKKSVYIDIKEDGTSKEEQAANKWAGDILIPENEYQKFIQRYQFYENHITTFANEINIHPGIIVGRLQHDGKIEHGWQNSLKAKYIITDENAGEK